ncbi:MAG: NAD(P)/FAD-dependent oxidoreductase [Clostridia bacterium]|nr:NAD(P)/FAD-dependent oxidoreductase [Clostridia bacterium]
MKTVIVIGGGASGLMAAYAAAKNGNSVILIEKNEKLGKKIYITGKGRCNLTNDCSPDDFLSNVVHGGKFLTGAAYGFPSEKTMAFMEEHGLSLKVERGNRVFPVSDHASDVTKTLERACKSVGVQIRLNETVKEINFSNDAIAGIITDIEFYPCDAAIVATGGISYPATGSTGDGYRFAEDAGHTLVTPVPSLVGIELKENFSSAQGIALKNVVLTAQRNDKTISSRMGELLFTHFGISGPLVLSLSAEINRLPLQEVILMLDFKPALDEKQLDARLLRDFAERKNEQIKNVMRGLLPAGIIPYVLRLCRIKPETRVNEVRKEERAQLINALKRFPLAPLKLRGFEEAVVTSGGVELKEINPKTMESKRISGLYFCGEVLDVDAYTGGFNLQIAFSTGYMAGNAI